MGKLSYAERKAGLLCHSNRWRVELPTSETIDEQWGGCRGVESAYEKTHQIGEGTYGQVTYEGSPLVHIITLI